MKYRKMLTLLMVVAVFTATAQNRAYANRAYARTLQDPVQTIISGDLKQDPFADAKREIEQRKTNEIKRIETEKRNDELKRSFLMQIDQNNAEIEEKQREAQEQASAYPDYAPAQEKNHHIEEALNTAKEIKQKAEELSRLQPISNDQLMNLKTLTDQTAQKMSEVKAIDLSVDCTNGYYNLSETRKMILDVANSLVGRISYSWGEKPDHAGWNEKWDDGLTGLDCSGFVQWVYWTATNEENAREGLGSTLNITHSCTEIGKDELLPGDLGTITTDGSYYLDQFRNKYYSEEEAKQGSITAGGDGSFRTITNHVGIYLGLDENGNKMWIHCYGVPKNTVVITTEEEFDKFVHYYRVLEK